MTHETVRYSADDYSPPFIVVPINGNRMFLVVDQEGRQIAASTDGDYAKEWRNELNTKGFIEV